MSAGSEPCCACGIEVVHPCDKMGTQAKMIAESHDPFKVVIRLGKIIFRQHMFDQGFITISPVTSVFLFLFFVLD